MHYSSIEPRPAPLAFGLPPPDLIGAAEAPIPEGLAAVTTISPPLLFELIAVLAGRVYKARHGKIIVVGQYEEDGYI